jgi:hypothetical protein
VFYLTGLNKGHLSKYDLSMAMTDNYWYCLSTIEQCVCPWEYCTAHDMLWHRIIFLQAQNAISTRINVESHHSLSVLATLNIWGKKVAKLNSHRYYVKRIWHDNWESADLDFVLNKTTILWSAIKQVYVNKCNINYKFKKQSIFVNNITYLCEELTYFSKYLDYSKDTHNCVY